MKCENPKCQKETCIIHVVIKYGKICDDCFKKIGDKKEKITEREENG